MSAIYIDIVSKMLQGQGTPVTADALRGAKSLYPITDADITAWEAANAPAPTNGHLTKAEIAQAEVVAEATPPTHWFDEVMEEAAKNEAAGLLQPLQP